MAKKEAALSLRRIILLMFMIALFISVSCYSALIFINWMSSAKETTEQIAADVNEEIYNRVYLFMQTPYQMNQLNHNILENGMLDLSDEKQRDRFFVGVLESLGSEIYSFSYGTAAGEYYGARRNENGVIEIMRNNAETGGNSWYYSVKDDLTAGELVVRAGKFDPRTRAWYKAAAEAEGPIFSPLYKHFVMDDLTVSAAWPVYNNSGNPEGVLGTHMLLSDIGSYLKNAVEKHNGKAVIIEKGSNYLIANSMGTANYAVLEDGKLKRYRLEDIENIDIQKAYGQYKTNNDPEQSYKRKSDNFFVNIKEIHMDGIDWVVISAIPESIFMTDVINSMSRTAIIGMLSLLLSVLIYNLFMNKYLKPMKSLLQVSDELSSGNLSERVEIIRNDEIGQISKSFNSVADKMQAFISDLESAVQERTEELKQANNTLSESTDELQLILNSAAEAIYGIDVNGNCTFCNLSCLKMLGYNDRSELLGKNMHRVIHHTNRSGSSLPTAECKIYKAINQGQGTHADDEVFWRADGTSFDVEYYSYPKIKNDEIVGAVVTFMDISDRKRKEEEILYLSCHDTLTGLHNRRCFEEHRAKIDNPDNLPLSVIFADINGLKITNDIFGHTAGDRLIKKSSEILRQVCRHKDEVARVGGDEFIILLPETTGESAEKILVQIRAAFAQARVEAVKCSISLGLDTKTSPDQALDDIMANAENAMYKDKIMNRNSNNKEIINTIIETLHARNSGEKRHSAAVSEICSEMGIALRLSETKIGKLSRAGYLHDIGKIVLDDNILTKETLTYDDLEKMRQHPVVGYRILNLFDDTPDLAEYICGHHERGDGTGYPRGLKGGQIPLISRIIAIVETYDRVLNSSAFPLRDGKPAALDVIKKGAGTRFDPQIAEIFIRLIDKKEEV